MKRAAADRRRNTGGAGFIGSHLVDLLGERRLPSPRHRQPGGRPTSEYRVYHHEGNPDCASSTIGISGHCRRTTLCLRGRVTFFILRALATSCLPSTARWITCPPMSREPSRCSKQRAMRPSESWSMPRRPLVMDWLQNFRQPNMLRFNRSIHMR